MTRRICAALSAVSCGSSRMPRRSSARVASSSRCISAAICLMPCIVSAKRSLASRNMAWVSPLCWVVDRAHRLGGAAALVLGAARASLLVLFADRARAFGARFRRPRGRSRGRGRRRLERFVEQAGEALEPLLDILGAGIERGDQRFDRGAALVDRRLRPARLLRSISSTAWRARGRATSNCAGELAEIGRRTRAVTSRKSAMVLSTLVGGHAGRGRSPRSWRRRIPTRAASACFRARSCSRASRDSTSCSRMLASRSRSNSAVVSARSMLWVSSISQTVPPRSASTARSRSARVPLQLVQRAVDRVGGGFARGVDQAGDFGAVVQHRAR